jgi:opacity protein-like surface antigen
MFRTIIAAIAVIFIASSAHADGKNFYVESQIGSTVRADNGRDDSGVMGLAVGKDLGHVRVDLSAIRHSSGDATSLGEVEVDSLLAGVYYDIGTYSKFTPFVGLNAGYGWADGLGVSSVDEQGLIYGAGVGVSYAASSNIDLITRYQYLTSSAISVTNDSGLDDWDSQAFTVGVRIGF